MAAHATAAQPTGAILREYLRRERIEKAPTIDAVPAIPIPKKRTFLPLEQEQPFLKVVNPDVDTITLVAEGLERFCLAYPGVTPEVVLGKALRYLEAWVSGPPLAYVYELGDYDVLIRTRADGPGQTDGSWLC